MEHRLLTQRQKIINALRDAGSEGITNAELSKISLRYGGHLSHLYRAGYRIKKFNLDGGLYNYVLIYEPADIKYFKNANEEYLDAVSDRYGTELSEELEGILAQKHFHVVRKCGWYEQQYDAL